MGIDNTELNALLEEATKVVSGEGHKLCEFCGNGVVGDTCRSCGAPTKPVHVAGGKGTVDEQLQDVLREIEEHKR